MALWLVNQIWLSDWSTECGFLIGQPNEALWLLTKCDSTNVAFWLVNQLWPSDWSTECCLLIGQPKPNPTWTWVRGAKCTDRYWEFAQWDSRSQNKKWSWALQFKRWKVIQSISPVPVVSYDPLNGHTTTVCIAVVKFIKLLLVSKLPKMSALFWDPYFCF